MKLPSGILGTRILQAFPGHTGPGPDRKFFGVIKTVNRTKRRGEEVFIKYDDGDRGW